MPKRSRTGSKPPSGARYRKVFPRIWTDEAFRDLDLPSKLIALYILTSRQANRVGIFSFSLALAAEEIGISGETFRKRFGNVCQTLNWKWDSREKVLFLPTWWRYNPPENRNVLIGNLADLRELPQTPLLQEFTNNTAHLPETFTHTFRERCGNVWGNVAPQEQEQEQGSKPPNPLFEKGGTRGRAGRREKRKAEQRAEIEAAIERTKDLNL